MGPAHHRCGPWRLWILPADKLYIREASGEGGVFSLPSFEAAVRPWNHLALVPGSTLEPLIAKFYGENF